MNKDFVLLKNDYNSSETPIFYDSKTLETLCSIAYSIYKGDYSEDDFYCFVDEYLGKGDFAKKSKDFVAYSRLFLLHSKRCDG